jgi:hypothetical protein
VTVPLSRLTVDRTWGRTKHVSATFAPGRRIARSVNLSGLEGLRELRNLGAAKDAMGAASGQWSDPFCWGQVPYYERPEARVSLCEMGYGEVWRLRIMAIPRRPGPADMISDSALRKQLMAVLGRSPVEVDLRGDEDNRISLIMSRDECQRLAVWGRDH